MCSPFGVQPWSKSFKRRVRTRRVAVGWAQHAAYDIKAMLQCASSVSSSYFDRNSMLQLRPRPCWISLERLVPPSSICVSPCCCDVLVGGEGMGHLLGEVALACEKHVIGDGACEKQCVQSSHEQICTQNGLDKHVDSSLWHADGSEHGLSVFECGCSGLGCSSSSSSVPSHLHCSDVDVVGKGDLAQCGGVQQQLLQQVEEQEEEEDFERLSKNLHLQSGGGQNISKNLHIQSGGAQPSGGPDSKLSLQVPSSKGLAVDARGMDSVDDVVLETFAYHLAQSSGVQQQQPQQEEEQEEEDFERLSKNLHLQSGGGQQISKNLQLQSGGGQPSDGPDSWSRRVLDGVGACENLSLQVPFSKGHAVDASCMDSVDHPCELHVSIGLDEEEEDEDHILCSEVCEGFCSGLLCSSSSSSSFLEGGAVDFRASCCDHIQCSVVGSSVDNIDSTTLEQSQDALRARACQRVCFLLPEVYVQKCEQALCEQWSAEVFCEWGMCKLFDPSTCSHQFAFDFMQQLWWSDEAEFLRSWPSWGLHHPLQQETDGEILAASVVASPGGSPFSMSRLVHDVTSLILSHEALSAPQVKALRNNEGLLRSVAQQCHDIVDDLPVDLSALPAEFFDLVVQRLVGDMVPRLAAAL